MRSPAFWISAFSLAVLSATSACGSNNSGSTANGADGGGSSSGDGAAGGSSGVAASGGAGSNSSGGAANSGSSSGGAGAGSSGGSGGGVSSGSDAGTTGQDGGDAAAGGDASGGGQHIKTVFLILMENSNWDNQNNGQQYIHGNSAAPYINNTLLSHSQASWCTNYFDNPSAVHPSEPNYIWLEAGDNLGFTTDDDPSASHLLTTSDHLAAYMTKAGVSWKEYAEDIDGTTCPISSTGNYGAKHVPFVFFSDIVGNPPSSTNQTCISHVRPYSELQADLQNGNVAAYNFITPNLCNDMHNACTGDAVGQGDTWLQQQLPTILNSSAYKNGGAVFITWDESEGGEFPIGMIVLSPFAKGRGYQSTKKYYHSSMLRTAQEVFGLSPLLRDAANQADLSDLFASFP